MKSKLLNFENEVSYFLSQKCRPVRPAAEDDFEI